MFDSTHQNLSYPEISPELLKVVLRVRRRRLKAVLIRGIKLLLQRHWISSWEVYLTGTISLHLKAFYLDIDELKKGISAFSDSPFLARF